MKMPSVGMIIRTKNQIRNYPEKDGERWEYDYHICKKGLFYLQCDNHVMKFKGIHFESLGSTYFHGFSGAISGLEILDEPYEVVDFAPSNLIQ